jgi:esterase/lipase superfamily enzyme
MPDYVISVRAVYKGKDFVSEPGRTRFLRVPSRKNPKPRHEIDRDEWLARVLKEAKTSVDPASNQPVGDILVFVHGYYSSPAVVIDRHRELKRNLAAVGYQGTVVSYDWPSAESALNYLEDRSDAKTTALRLVSDGIALLAESQTPDCRINVHLLGHSMGAYVIREAFDDADDRPSIAATNWTVSQLCLIGADISSSSMSAGNPKSSSLYRHAVRVTNYYNPFDNVLKLSNVKRIGTAPRLGRIGLPEQVPAEAVDIDTGPYYSTLREDWDDPLGVEAHSWYIGNRLFIQDLFFTLQGDLDRHAIPTRQRTAAGRLILHPAQES